MTTNEKENTSPKVKTEKPYFTTEEKAQYEVFRNGSLPKETIEKWIRNDLNAVLSFVHGCLSDAAIFDALAGAYYERYKNLHAEKIDKDHEPTRTTTN